jgi:hypothetical protein
MGMERFASDVLPDLFGVVLTLNIDEARIPIGFLSRDIIASLEEQDSLPGGSQSVTQSPSAGSRADNDDIEFIVRGHNQYQWPLSKAPASDSTPFVDWDCHSLHWVVFDMPGSEMPAEN